MTQIKLLEISPTEAFLIAGLLLTAFSVYRRRLTYTATHAFNRRHPFHTSILNPGNPRPDYGRSYKGEHRHVR